MNSNRIIGIGAAVVCAVAGMGALWQEANRPADPKFGNADITWTETFDPDAAEDEPGWNCFTHGNGDCGTTLTYFEREGDPETLGAVLPVATDGIVYVSWSDGAVTPATEIQRSTAWRVCVEVQSDGSDAGMFACDADYQNPGDRFDMRTL
jgi:hypothetical protein